MQEFISNILRPQAADKKYRDAVRAGRIQPDQFTNWNISDRD